MNIIHDSQMRESNDAVADKDTAALTTEESSTAKRTPQTCKAVRSSDDAWIYELDASVAEEVPVDAEQAQRKEAFGMRRK